MFEVGKLYKIIPNSISFDNSKTILYENDIILILKIELEPRFNYTDFPEYFILTCLHKHLMLSRGIPFHRTKTWFTEI